MLPVNERVEVRSDENGFEGSWHPGTIVACGRQGWHFKYDIKYDHILADDESKHLVGHARASMLVDDSNYRGRIRPLPPRLQFGKWGLPYGICVDAYYQEGWWEGVIFDHEDGSEKRRTFFPDLGEEMMIGINELRITQDWNEVTGTWHRRGTWLFLELVELCEQEQYLLVSVKQLWSDLREKEGFKKLGEWASSSRALWGELVFEAIRDNLKIAVKNLIHVLDLPKETQKLLGIAGPVGYDNLKSQADMADAYAIIPFERSLTSNLPSSNARSSQATSSEGQLMSHVSNDWFNVNVSIVSDICCLDKEVCAKSHALLASSSNLNGNSVINCLTNKEIFSGSKSVNVETGWLPAVPDMVSGPEFCPDTVTKYASGSEGRGDDIITDIRKHLLFLKWKIEFMKDKTTTRFRYISPDGKCYYSLLRVCQHLCQLESEILSPISLDEQISSQTCDDSLCTLKKEVAEHQGLRLRSKDAAPPQYHEMFVEPEYCHQAIVDWYERGKDNKIRRADRDPMVWKARKHLSAIGWVFSYTTNRGYPELRYTSPRGTSYFTLRKACREALSVGAGRRMKRSDVSNAAKEMESEKSRNDHKEPPSTPHGGEPGDLKSSGKGRKVQGKIKNSLRLAACLLGKESYSRTWNVSQGKMRCGRRMACPIKLQNHEREMQPYRAPRSRKRVQRGLAPNPSDQSPRNVLSWLIEKNILLPRAKVYYRSRNNGHLIAEGRVNRDSIKCHCCSNLYTVSGFAIHAGRKISRPASSIFLEDGRSLLDCQMQLIHEKMKNFQAERLSRNWQKDENDYVCSVCHYGGSLILCDQCPSSFHDSCLGMENIPDGEWFCPSCCCCICGQNKVNEDDEHCMDNGVLCCSQCEQKYHKRCLKNRGINLSSYPKDNWFCSKKCKMVFLGLSDLLCKQIPLGKSKFTWTLLKPRWDESCKLDASDVETRTEMYCKLSIAVDIMHECFDPIDEPHTRTDLIEDAIFGRRSGLKRLNFQGFYTAVLEKDDELITVAILRVHGEEVAEIPLIGTRVQHRRRGMCRMLMNVLEKKLKEFGVQRLVLPAAPNVLNTWTSSFGFSKMTDSEKVELVKYTFLDFQGAVMCCKLLMDIVSAESSQPTERQPRLCNDACRTHDVIDLGGSSVTASEEVLQVDYLKSGGLGQQEFMDDAVGNNSSDGNDKSPVSLVNQPSNADCKPCPSEISLECWAKDCTIKKRSWNSDKGSTTFNEENRASDNGDLKCYKRRRLLVSQSLC